MNESPDLRAELEQMIAKSDRSAQAARILLRAANFEFAAARAYYTAFYALQAALRSIDLSFKKHSGVTSEFGRQFVKTGVFPPEFGKYISQLFSDRQVGDYDFDEVITEDIAHANIEVSEKILASIKQHLKQKGFIRSDA